MRKNIIILFCLYLNVNAIYINDKTEDDNFIVYDTTTTLIWQDDNNILYGSHNWKEAIDYCEALEKKGFTNWRLPNINELESIVDDTLYDPAISNIFYNKLSERYWSSTTVINDTTNAWSTDFLSGEMTDLNPKSEDRRVRCVRDTK